MGALLKYATRPRPINLVESGGGGAGGTWAERRSAVDSRAAGRVLGRADCRSDSTARPRTPPAATRPASRPTVDGGAPTTAPLDATARAAAQGREPIREWEHGAARRRSLSGQ